MSADIAFQRLAVASYLRKAAADVESGLKAELLDVMEPGDRKRATIEGQQIATISRAEIKEAETVTVTDEAALIAWARKNAPDAVVTETREFLAPWFTATANLEATIAATGELPDGVEYSTRTTGGYITVRQTDTQKTNLRTLAADGALSALVTELAQIEGNRNE